MHAASFCNNNSLPLREINSVQRFCWQNTTPNELLKMLHKRLFPATPPSWNCLSSLSCGAAVAIAEDASMQEVTVQGKAARMCWEQHQKFCSEIPPTLEQSQSHLLRMSQVASVTLTQSSCSSPSLPFPSLPLLLLLTHSHQNAEHPLPLDSLQ